MPKFRVTIEGRSYEVDVEQIDDERDQNRGAGSATAGREETAPQEGSASLPQGTQIKAPLAGTVLSVFVSKEDTVTKGQVILTLEALKLENEITAPQDGTVKYVVAEGTSAEIGEALAVIE